jgi:hypothetical protein
MLIFINLYIKMVLLLIITTILIHNKNKNSPYFYLIYKNMHIIYYFQN